MDEFFSIDADNAARSGLRQFEADAGIKDVGFRAFLTYSFSERWSATGVGIYQRLLNDAADSPVTDDEGDPNQFFGGVLVSFKF